MPNHVHFVLIIRPMKQTGRAKRAPYGSSEISASLVMTADREQKPSKSPVYDKVSAPLIVNQYNSYVTKAINSRRDTPNAKVWQRSYRDHVVRDENDLHRIREYIQYNPLSWDLDRDNPAAVGVDELDNWLQKRKGLSESPAVRHNNAY